MIEADIIVLGSGFAGSLTALLLEREGFDVVVVDRAVHPRFAIGESSTPIADIILRDMAERYELPRLRPLSRYGTWKETYPELGVGRKRGFSYFHHERGQAFEPRGDHSNELLVAASSSDVLSDTHWFRADVDAFLAGQVREAGIPLLEGTEITSIDRAAGWELDGRHGADAVRMRGRFLVDATGAGAAVAQALGVKDTADRYLTKSRAVFSHFDGVRMWEDSLRGIVSEHPYDCDAAALHHVFDGGWMWVLRFDHGVVSAGFMLDAERFPLENDTRSPEEEWRQWLDRFPSVAEQFAAARIMTPPGRIIRTGRLQRRAGRIAGEGWAMLPHSAGFVDPLHSTGIAHSLSGIERLVAILARHGAGGPALQDELAEYGRAVHHELDFIDRLVASCYASMHDFRLFAASVMLYFAAVIRYERLRASCDGPFEGGFLSADEPSLVALAHEALDRLRGGCDAASFEAFVERGIRPFNTAGLFHSAVPNMYNHTAASV